MKNPKIVHCYLPITGYQTHKIHMTRYPTNLTDSQWCLLDGILQDDRKRKHPLRDLLHQDYHTIKILSMLHNP